MASSDYISRGAAMIWLVLGVADVAVTGVRCACVLGAQEDERQGWK